MALRPAWANIGAAKLIAGARTLLGAPRAMLEADFAALMGAARAVFALTGAALGTAVADFTVVIGDALEAGRAANACWYVAANCGCCFDFSSAIDRLLVSVTERASCV